MLVGTFSVGGTLGMAVGGTVGTILGMAVGGTVGMVVGTAVGTVVGSGCDSDGSDVGDLKGFRCHGLFGTVDGVLVGGSSSSSSMSTGSFRCVSVNRLLMLGEGTCTVEIFFLMARRCPLTVASALGGYLRSWAAVMDGNVVK